MSPRLSPEPLLFSPLLLCDVAVLVGPDDQAALHGAGAGEVGVELDGRGAGQHQEAVFAEATGDALERESLLMLIN